MNYSVGDKMMMSIPNQPKKKEVMSIKRFGNSGYVKRFGGMSNGIKRFGK